MSEREWDGPPLKVTAVPAIIKGPFCKWYRNPIWWWKMRHLRHDIALYQDELGGMISAEMERKLVELEDDLFLNGTGGK